MNKKGFTLIELLVTLAVASIVMGAVFVMYNAQLQTQATRLASTEMTQHARAAMMILEREIRSAATDPTGYAGAEFTAEATGVLGCNSTQIRFTRDIRGGLDPIGVGDKKDNDRDGQTDEADEWYDGDVNDPDEDIRYVLSASSLVRDSGNTGFPDRVADNIEVLNFVYLNSAGTAFVPNATNIDDIRAVQVTLIARSDNPVLMRDQTDRTNYTNLQGTVILPAPNDTVRRIMLSTEIRVRNTGLKS